MQGIFQIINVIHVICIQLIEHIVCCNGDSFRCGIISYISLIFEVIRNINVRCSKFCFHSRKTVADDHISLSVGDQFSIIYGNIFKTVLIQYQTGNHHEWYVCLGASCFIFILITNFQMSALSFQIRCTDRLSIQSVGNIDSNRKFFVGGSLINDIRSVCRPGQLISVCLKFLIAFYIFNILQIRYIGYTGCTSYVAKLIGYNDGFYRSTLIYLCINGLIFGCSRTALCAAVCCICLCLRGCRSRGFFCISRYTCKSTCYQCCQKCTGHQSSEFSVFHFDSLL